MVLTTIVASLASAGEGEAHQGRRACGEAPERDVRRPSGAALGLGGDARGARATPRRGGRADWGSPLRLRWVREPRSREQLTLQLS